MVRPADVEALKQLALRGAMEEAIELASTEFADLLDVSQQTGSRRLIELTDEGLVSREMGVRKQRIRITDAGRELLRGEHLLYQRLFERPDHLDIQGTVETGLGEGRYYLSRPGYETQFQDALGWTPYPGTLNLALSGTEASKLRVLKRNPVHIIHGFEAEGRTFGLETVNDMHGFEAEGRTFGGVTCHPATIDKTACAAILPNRSHYTQTLEIIAPASLRKGLPCDDGDRIDVMVHLNPEA